MGNRFAFLPPLDDYADTLPAFSCCRILWERVSNTTPVTPGGKHEPPDQKWQSAVVYQPFLVESNGTYYDIYNARGVNAAGAGAEETGLRTLPVDTGLPGLKGNNSSEWLNYANNPIIASGPAGSIETHMASDPKVFCD